VLNADCRQNVQDLRPRLAWRPGTLASLYVSHAHEVPAKLGPLMTALNTTIIGLIKCFIESEEQ
jgi:hypothetical protein